MSHNRNIAVVIVVSVGVFALLTVAKLVLAFVVVVFVVEVLIF